MTNGLGRPIWHEGIFSFFSDIDVVPTLCLQVLELEVRVEEIEALDS